MTGRMQSPNFTRMQFGTRIVTCTRLVAVAALAACGGGEEEQRRGWGPDNAVIPSVEVVQARLDALPLQERLTGTVEAGGQVGIYPQATGAITAVYAQNGDRVRAGQALVAIESRSSRSQLAQAQASLTVARAQERSAAARLSELESQFERTMLLAADSLVSQASVETERAQVESARSALAQAQAGVRSAEAAIDAEQEAVGRTVVRAPIEGVVGQRNAEVGMITSGQTPLFIIGQVDRMRVKVPIAQDLIGRVAAGQRALIRTEALYSTPIDAEVSRISPFLAPGSFSAEAEIDVPEAAGRLIPGMFVTVDVFYGETDSATVVPKSALYDHPESGAQGVFVVEPADSTQTLLVSNVERGNRDFTEPEGASFVPVSIVADGRQTVGVAGIRPGQWVVVIGQNLLNEQRREGGPVARLRATSWERIIELQERQGTELLREVLEEQLERGMSAEVPGSRQTPADVRGS